MTHISVADGGHGKRTGRTRMTGESGANLIRRRRDETPGLAPQSERFFYFFVEVRGSSAGEKVVTQRIKFVGLRNEFHFHPRGVKLFVKIKVSSS